jgi:nickel transport protein
MNRNIKPANLFLLVIAALTVLLRAAGVNGHDLWLERTEGGYILRYGHLGSGCPSVERTDYLYAEVECVQCFDTSGAGTEAEIARKDPVRIEGNFPVVSVLIYPEYWSETPFGFKNLPKDKAGSSIRSWLSIESVKRIDSWRDWISSPLTDSLDIVPLKNPLETASGGKIRLLVTFGGSPAAGATVAYGDEPRGVTDSRGRINIRLRHGGLQLIKASLRQPGDGIKSDEVVYTAALVFEIEREGD